MFTSATTPVGDHLWADEPPRRSAPAARQLLFGVDPLADGSV
ncbi:hypothetical protein [Prescottella equi]|nr:hypothetical protein [Prescottella equi]